MWREKEDILTSLYEGHQHAKSNHNNNNNVESQVEQNGHAMSGHDRNVKNSTLERLSQEVREKETLSSLRHKFVEQKDESELKVVHYVLFIWWSIFSVISVYGVWNSVPAQVIGLIVIAITLFVNFKYGGWDYLEMNIHRERMLQQQKSS